VKVFTVRTQEAWNSREYREVAFDILGFQEEACKQARVIRNDGA
jgi:hypothetical protein